jgi:hypothetical protein
LNNHLLSIFPVWGREIYARVTCTTLSEVTFRSAKPFTCSSPACLRTRLSACFADDAADEIVTLIDCGEIVHRQISDADARSLGFLPLLQ